MSMPNASILFARLPRSLVFFDLPGGMIEKMDCQPFRKKSRPYYVSDRDDAILEGG